MQRIAKNEIVSQNIQVLETAGSSYDAVNGVMIGTPSEDPNFLMENIIDLHPKKVAKAQVSDALFSVNVSDADTNAIAIFNTNASTARIEILDETGTTQFDQSYELKGATSYLQFITNRGKLSIKDLYVSYPNLSLPHIINVYLSGPLVGPVVSVGVMFIGREIVIVDPLQGVSQSTKDYSIVAETANGGTYILKRRIVRTFSFTEDMCDSSSEPSGLIDTFLEIGPNPIPWILVSKDGTRWLVFARKMSEPDHVFYTFNRVQSNINLIEVL